jgi:ABC-type transport system substrate-binding protein
MPDENARINALKSGQIDLNFPVSPINIPSLEKDPSLVLNSSSQVAFYQIYINTAKPPLDNQKVRQAINYAIDREAIVKAVLFGKGEPAYQPFPSGYWASDPNLTIPYDPEKAKQLLAESGLSNVSIDMPYYPSGSYERLAEVVREQLKAVGINVDLQGMELNKGVSEYFQEKRHNTYLSRWTGRPDPQMTVSLAYSNEGYYNAGKKTSPELEAMISKAAATYDQKQRAELYAEISKKAILDEAISAPIYFEPATAVMSPKVKGYESNLLGKPKIAFLWLEK